MQDSGFLGDRSYPKDLQKKEEYKNSPKAEVKILTSDKVDPSHQAQRQERNNN